jgi:2-dehydropantoate 2-reductase
MRVLIVGTGAIGSVVGGYLALSGAEVTLLGRAAHMAAVQRDGLRITGIWGDRPVRGLHTATSADEIIAGNFDVIVVAVKAYDTAAAARLLAPLAGPDTLVLAYQNGLGNAEALAEVLGWPRVVGVRAIYGARIPTPGEVTVTVIAQPTALGTYSPETDYRRVRELAERMDAAGLPTVYDDAIATTLWAKVAYNCALNPMSALLDVPYGALAETAYTRDIMRDVVEELYAVGAARGVSLRPATPAAYMDHFYTAMLPPTAAHYASMREDLLQRKRTEIDALNGAIVAFGAAAGIPTPANLYLTRLVHAREAALGIVPG